MFCQKCGNKINNEDAVVCINCGCSLSMNLNHTSNNRGLIVILLCLFLGCLGIHRFYTGHTTIGIIQLLTLGGCGIWALIDFIILLMGDFKDANGLSVTIR
ncbi:MAG: TM2 domain-containing protein [Bacteroidota bacterium]|nr:TM2 domain-containing protein [Bacteroidota bacterium]